jgi:hypothetical protein
MHPQYLGAVAMGPGVSFCQLDYTSNGILVKYQEAQRRRRRIPSPLAGLDMSYFQMIFEVISQQMGSGEDWEGDKKNARLERIKEALKSAKMPTEDKFTEEWVTIEKTIFCPAMKDIPAAVQTAYDAYLGIIAIQKEGDHVMPGGMGMGQAFI